MHILTGGLLQTLLVALLCRYVHVPLGNGSDNPCVLDATESSPQQIPFDFAVRIAITVAVAGALYQWSAAQNGYWIPMNALIVFRPDRRETVQRGVARMAGTIAGAAVASAIVIGLAPGAWFLIAGITLCMWGSYALINYNYALFAVCLAAYVVFLLSLAGLKQGPLVEHRVVFTAAGGVLALGMHWLRLKREFVCDEIVCRVTA